LSRILTRCRKKGRQHKELNDILDIGKEHNDVELEKRKQEQKRMRNRVLERKHAQSALLLTALDDNSETIEQMKKYPLLII
jgi:hypothetical protein